MDPDFFFVCLGGPPPWACGVPWAPVWELFWHSMGQPCMNCIYVTMNSGVILSINKLTGSERYFQGIVPGCNNFMEEPQWIVSGNVDLLATLFPRKKCTESVFIGSLAHSTKHGSHNSLESEHFFWTKVQTWSVHWVKSYTLNI